MEPSPLFQFSLRDVFRILFRHRYRSLAVFVLILLISLAALTVLPHEYESEAQLLVKVGVESLSVDPTTTKPGSVSLQVAREEEIQSALDLFRSREIAQEVVHKLGADVVLGRSTHSTQPAQPSGLRAQIKQFIGSPYVADQQKAVSHVLKAVTVVAQPKSNVIRVTARANTPAGARRLAAAFVEVAVKTHANAHQTKNSTEFLERKTQETHDRLKAATQQLRDVKTRVGVVSIEGQKRQVEEQISSLQRLLVTAQTDLHTYQQRVRSLRRIVPDLPDNVDPNTSSMSTEALNEMRNKLFALRITANGLATKYTAQHPAVVAVREQLRQSAEKLDVEELRFALANVATLRAKISALEDKLLSRQQQLKTVNANEVEITRLQNEVGLLQESYVSYRSNLKTARIIEDRRKQQISNINVFQPATEIDEPSSPNRHLIVALGLAAALFGSLSLAAVSEFLDASLKTPDEVEQQLEVPVLQTIPSVATRRTLLP